jgi:hypothetical protein
MSFDVVFRLGLLPPWSQFLSHQHTREQSIWNQNKENICDFYLVFHLVFLTVTQNQVSANRHYPRPFSTNPKKKNIRKVTQSGFVWHHRAWCTIFLPMCWLRQVNLLKFQQISCLEKKDIKLVSINQCLFYMSMSKISINNSTLPKSVSRFFHKCWNSNNAIITWTTLQNFLIILKSD